MSDPTIQERIALAIEARADKLSATFPARQRPAVASGMIEGYRAAARIARETTGWIASSEQLPEVGKIVIGEWDGGMDAVWRSKDGFWWIDARTEVSEPDHWQPLPTPPEETPDGHDVGPAAHVAVRTDAGGGDGMTWEGYNR